VSEFAVDFEGEVIGELEEATVSCLPGVIDASCSGNTLDTLFAEAINPKEGRSAMASSSVEISWAIRILAHSLGKV